MSDLIRVLFVDDEVSVLNALKRQVREMPYEAHFCNEPMEATRLVKELSFDVLVSDERMPVLTGLELIERVKNSSPETICILLTGELSVQKIMKAMNKGMVYKYLAKPCNVVELVQAIESSVRAKSIKRKVCQLIEENKQRAQLMDEAGVACTGPVLNLSDIDLDELARELEGLGL